MTHYYGFIVLLLLVSCGGKSDYINSVEREHVRRNAVFIDPTISPLNAVEITTFKGLHFYQADESFKVNATLTWLPQIGYIDMPQTGGDVEQYLQTAVIDFELKGKTFQLPIYQNEEMKIKRILFIPFMDLTNGKDTYNGGRYIDLPYNDHRNAVELDFNHAYIPYCAHTVRYSCPKVPKENFLKIAIEAGEKL